MILRMRWAKSGIRSGSHAKPMWFRSRALRACGQPLDQGWALQKRLYFGLLLALAADEPSLPGRYRHQAGLDPKWACPVLSSHFKHIAKAACRAPLGGADLTCPE